MLVYKGINVWRQLLGPFKFTIKVNGSVLWSKCGGPNARTAVFFCRDFGCFFGTCGKTLVQHGPFAWDSWEFFMGFSERREIVGILPSKRLCTILWVDHVGLVGLLIGRYPGDTILGVVFFLRQKKRWCQSQPIDIFMAFFWIFYRDLYKLPFLSDMCCRYCGYGSCGTKDYGNPWFIATHALAEQLLLVWRNCGKVQLCRKKFGWQFPPSKSWGTSLQKLGVKTV